MAAKRFASIQALKGKSANDQAAQEHQPPGLKELRQPDHHRCQQWQFLVHRVELFDDARHNENQQSDDHAKCHNGEDRRIDQRADGLAAHGLALFKVHGEPVEYRAERPGLFPRCHHGAKKRREGFFLRTHGIGKRAPLHDTCAHTGQHALARRALGRPAHRGNCLFDRRARRNQHGKLAGEKDQFGRFELAARAGL